MDTADTTGADSGVAPDADAIVACEDVVREYAGPGGGGVLGRGRDGGRSVRAVDGVSVRVDRGEVVGIAGPSGSGKSTLLHLLGALDTPTSGRVTIGGTDTADLSGRERTRLRLDRVGVVFQRFHLLPSLSARANVAVPLIERGVSKAERRARADDLLATLGLADRVDHRPGTLSGGERQRVAIARALVTEPDLLVADEPTGELDRAAGRDVLDHLDAAADTGRAVVLASHDESALAATDRVVRLVDGRRADADTDAEADANADREGNGSDDVDADREGDRVDAAD